MNPEYLRELAELHCKGQSGIAMPQVVMRFRDSCSAALLQSTTAGGQSITSVIMPQRMGGEPQSAEPAAMAPGVHSQVGDGNTTPPAPSTFDIAMGVLKAFRAAFPDAASWQRYLDGPDIDRHIADCVSQTVK